LIKSGTKISVFRPSFGDDLGDAFGDTPGESLGDGRPVDSLDDAIGVGFFISSFPLKLSALLLGVTDLEAAASSAILSAMV
jgi:hypothetical protein